MSRLRFSVIAGTAGLLGGFFLKEKYTSPSNVFAAKPRELPTSTPLQRNDPDNYMARNVLFGNPNVSSLRRRESFDLAYDHRNKIAFWVYEHLTSDIQGNGIVNRSKSEFFEDNSMHKFFRSTIDDYKDSSYDKGHLASANNHKHSQEHLDDTFVLSNIAPQVGKDFNRRAWKKLENHVNHFVNQYKNVYVYTGPLFLPMKEPDDKWFVKYQVIGDNRVAVPTHFFKVIVGETEDKKLDMESYVMPNTAIDNDIPLSAFLERKDTIEKAAGFLLFENLPPTAFRKINGLKPKL